MGKRFYGAGIPNTNISELKGHLIVIEGPDGSGRSTQTKLLRDRLERDGFPTTEIGLKRSVLVGPELEAAMEGNILGPTTLSLFYATDLADQIENTIIPALRAGFIVIADRYVYTLMARDIVRGAMPEWVKGVFNFALVPDLIFYLDVPPKTLVDRIFQHQGHLSYWESGMDIERSGDRYECFLNYQERIAKEYKIISKSYKFIELDGTSPPMDISSMICKRVKTILGASKSAEMSLIKTKSQLNRSNQRIKSRKMRA